MKYNKDIVVKWFAEHGLLAVPEQKFHLKRKWRFDFILTCPIQAAESSGLGDVVPRVALEVEGGVWTGGRHTRGSGFKKDMEKYNEAAALGWRIIRVTPDDLCTMDTIELIKRALNV